MKIRLLVVTDTGPPVPFETENPETLIGRAAECQVRFAASNVVSTRHAVIELSPSIAYITDLGSRNGTYVNGRRVTAKTTLRQGDEVQLGQRGPTLRVERLEVPDAEGMTVCESPGMPPRSLPGTLDEPDFIDEEPLPVRRPAARPITATRVRDVRPPSNHKLLLFGGAGLLVVAAATVILIWQLGKRKGSGGGSDAPLSAEEMYRRQLDSAVYIEVVVPNPKKPDELLHGRGSGCLIDKKEKLILTAYHVIANARKVAVVFPKFKDGKPVTDHTNYDASDLLPATIVKSDSSKDLAILKLEKVPDHAKELPMAKESPGPNEEVYTVGGKPRGSTGLWIPTKGNVREVVKTTMLLDGRQHVDAWVVSTTNPINPGDSGGALVNKRCELVGVCSGSDESATLVRSFIDVREVSGFIGLKSPSSEVKTTDNSGKTNQQKIVGKWKIVKGEDIPTGTIIEFTAGGKVDIHGVKNGAPTTVNAGEYRIEGDRLTLISKKGGAADTETAALRFENPNRMTLTGSDKKETVFERVR
jgi:uncharacterized protein (TIGR03066 family)